MTPQQEFAALFKRMYQICEQQQWGDPFSYARSREIHMANTLGHQIASTLSGADAIDEDGECEYKSTIGPQIQATYNGISVQPSWEQQLAYLTSVKIGKYKNHYYARYDGANIVELYKMSADKVLDYIVPKLHTQYHREKKGKDPRLGATIPKKYIIEHATLMNVTTHSSSQNTPEPLHNQSTSVPSLDTPAL